MNALDLKQIDNLIKKRLENVATKNDVQSIVKNELSQYATKDDLRRFATKDDLNRKLSELKKDVESKMDEIAVYIISSVDKTKADQEDLEILEKRVDKIEERLELS